MDTKQPLSLFLVAILAASVFTLVGISSLPVQRVSAQGVTVETSADELGGTFYGESFLQVVIEDPDADDDDTVEDISVTVDVEGGEATFDLPETSDSSGRFEFFLVHEDSDLDETLLDPIADSPFIVSFGPDGATSGGIPANETITADVTMGDDTATVNIDPGDNDVDIDYDQDTGVLDLDRDQFGSTSLVHVFITDQDSNNDPTNADSFTVVEADLNGATFDDLFEVTGATFTDDVTFDETGDNSAVFEAIIQLTTADSATEDELDFTADTVTLELHDHADYGDISPPEDGDVVEDSTDTSEVSFEIDDVDGDIDDLADLTFGGELVATIRDNDRNVDSDDDDTIEFDGSATQGGLIVTVDGAAGADEEFLDLEETGDNTGVFQIDASNGELRVTFLSNADAPVANNTILELRSEDIEEDIVVSYSDPTNDDGDSETTSEFTIAIALIAGQISAPEEVGVTDEFTATLTEQDLNDNPRTRDSYVIALDGASPFDLERGGESISEVYTIELELDGEDLSFPAPIDITMTETGINTGIFEFDIDMEDDIDDGAEVGGDDVEISDGDELTITVNDFMADVGDADEDEVSISIGKPNVGVDYDRTSPPIPPNTGTGTIDATYGVGGDVIVRLILTDPTLATDSNVEETFDFDFGTTAGNFTLEVEGDDIDDCTVGAGETLVDCDIGAVTLDAILDIGDLEETGDSTSVFESELTFSDSGAGFDTGDLQDAEFSFTYTNDEGDEETAGFTFRGNDGVVTVDIASATAGTMMTVTVEDQDLNIDSGEIDQFESKGGADDPFLVGVETEDDDLDVADIEEVTFEETGEDTGVFEAQFEVGEDIPISDVAAEEQASNILITFNDEIDSAGGGGDEIEVNVPVVSSTGSIQVTPELVGPATTLNILIVDADLNEDAGSTDEYTAAELDERVEFSSSRNEVDEAVPDIEETGPDTGVFMFELELITDETACADDDLGDAEFDATGEDTDSSIGACPGDLIAIRYEDEQTGGGGGGTVSEVIEVMSWDPEFVADQDSYDIGDRVTITVSDPDANRDPDIADSLTDIRVRSDSDQVGEEFSAIETGRDTGVFRLTFGTTSGTAGGAISVKTGDDITTTYTDEFPADFVTEEEDKDFDFVVTVGGVSGVGSTTATAPALTDVSGQELDEVTAGQQVVITTDVRNNQASSLPFTAIVEVRDSDGITVYLQWQTGTLNANGQTQVGLSWTPDNPGDYEVRTFVISNLNNPQVLSLVATSDITVS